MARPAPARFANYHGDLRHMAEGMHIHGPNTLGEMLTAVTAEYDEEANTTRVGFAYGWHRKEAEGE